MAEIALPTGEVVKPGSVCFKSVSGLDVVKILSSSWGLLGMIITATLRVLPLTVRNEYDELALSAVDYRNFCRLYSSPGDNVAAQYSLKIKRKFDPKNILPLISI
jgi:FAD/FMN-containing dehydrogenase